MLESLLKNKASSLFASPSGSELYNTFQTTIKRYSMESIIRGGVLVGLSGGADSVMLLLVLLEYRHRVGADFSIAACHINHMIRGAEAKRDQDFSRELCDSLEVEFFTKNVNVPEIAQERGIGVEEAARNERYSAFQEIILGRERILAIATAHNSNDNCETILYNLCRGASLRGASGIPPVRGNIVRPMVDISKESIVSLLDDFDIPYVTDSTNDSDDYTRNYIRHNILPHLSRINPAFLRAFSAFSYSAREDNFYLDTIAENALADVDNTALPLEHLRQMPYSIFTRVITRIAKDNGLTLESTHLNMIYDAIVGDNYSLSVPGADFVSERGVCYFRPVTESSSPSLYCTLEQGMNILPGFNAVFIVNNCVDDSYRNVYKFSISTTISSDIIVGSVSVRLKQDGDSYRYGGMTHKLKKVFNDLDIPPSIRSRIPIVTDEKGILWVPGLPPRDNGGSSIDENPITFTFAVTNDGAEPLYSATKYNIKRRKEIT